MLFFCLPPFFHMGSPHMETGTLFLPSIESRSVGASPNILAEEPMIPSHLHDGGGFKPEASTVAGSTRR